MARHVYETGTRNGKRVQALGGAKNHMVVLPDADIDVAADAAVSAGYGSAGERCMAISVVVAVGSVADALVEAVADRIPSVVVGPGDSPDSMMGPLITGEHRDRVPGLRRWGGRPGGPSGGGWPRPRSHRRVSSSAARSSTTSTPGMKVYDDEIFGPVLSVVRVPTFAEAVSLVNSNPYGNGVAMFTRDGGAARRFERSVKVGMVGVNVPIPVPVASHSFGGWKASHLRRQSHLRSGGDPLLHPAQGGHLSLARRRF